MEHFYILVWLPFTTVEMELDYIIRKLTYELPHKMLNALRLSIIGDEKILVKKNQNECIRGLVPSLF